MNIRIIIPSLGQGGAEHFSVELLKKLQSHGLNAKLQILTNSRKEIKTKNLNIEFFKSNRVIKSIPKLIYLRLKNYDELWMSTGLQSNVAVFIISFLTGSLDKLSIRFNNPYEFDLNLINSVLLKKLIIKYIKCCRKVIFQSNSMKASYIKEGIICDNIVIPNFSDRKYTLINNRSDVIYFFNVSRIVDQKDHLFLINMIYELKKQKILCQLTIFGSGPGEAALLKKIAELGLKREVLFKGKSSIDEIIVPNDAIYLQSSRFEGFPNSIIEALNTKLKVIDFTENFKSEYLESCKNYTKLEKDNFSVTNFIKHCFIDSNDLAINQNSSIERYIQQCL
jgi:glycosyltransferase involved in cell wall biosynthesis